MHYIVVFAKNNLFGALHIMQKLASNFGNLLRSGKENIWS